MYNLDSQSVEAVLNNPIILLVIFLIFIAVAHGVANALSWILKSLFAWFLLTKLGGKLVDTLIKHLEK